MFAKERHAKISRMIYEKGAVTTSELIERFGVSIETVRRDLLELEKRGELLRVHGGAVSSGEMMPFDTLPQRLEECTKEKEELSRKAAEFVKENEVIFIDSGSTALFFARTLMKKVSKLTVVTHSLDVFDVLSKKEGFDVILCGGNFMKSENAFYGKLALDTLKSIYVNKVFIFPSAVSLNNGIRDFNQELSQIQLCAMGCGDEIFVLADSNKFEKKTLLKISEMDSRFTYVTDSGLNEAFRRLYEENGIRIIC